MANPTAAEAYGADSEFDDPSSAVEFKPSRRVGYYRRHGTHVVEEDPLLGRRVVDPGILSTEYPHAGILNTTVFLKRYPTTATNRNLARPAGRIATSLAWISRSQRHERPTRTHWPT